jgi:hypothetical protein
MWVSKCVVLNSRTGILFKLTGGIWNNTHETQNHIIQKKVNPKTNVGLYYLNINKRENSWMMLKIKKQHPMGMGLHGWGNKNSFIVLLYCCLLSFVNICKFIQCFLQHATFTIKQLNKQKWAIQELHNLSCFY